MSSNLQISSFDLTSASHGLISSGYKYSWNNTQWAFCRPASLLYSLLSMYFNHCISQVASLIHDDVLDDADTRRGIGSLNNIMRNKDLTIRHFLKLFASTVILVASCAGAGAKASCWTLFWALFWPAGLGGLEQGDKDDAGAWRLLLMLARKLHLSSFVRKALRKDVQTWALLGIYED